MKAYLQRFLIIYISISLLLTGCQKTASAPFIRRNGFVMGTLVTLTLYDTQDETILDTAFHRIQELEDILSVNKEGTLLDKINAMAGIAPQQVDQETFDLIKKGLYYGELTEGAFDLSIGPLVALWHIGFEDARVPEPSEIQKILPLIDYRKVILDSQNSTIYLPEKGMCLDLGAIAKGYVADEVAELLQKEGVKSATIDLGGNTFVLGEKAPQTPFTIGVRNPFNPRGAIIGKLKLTNRSAVTSGTYERYLEVEGKRYHHLLSPQTGYPFDNELVGVTIISKASLDGDALSTSVFALGLEEGLNFINTQEGIDALFVAQDKKIYITEGLKNIFTLTDSTFTLASSLNP